MSNLELKGNILEMIAHISDRDILEELKVVIKDLTEADSEEDDFLDEIGDFEKRELLIAIEESKHEENLIPHEEFKKTYSKWLEK